MFALTGLCTLVSSACCSSSWGTCSGTGIGTLNWDFFTQLPAPVGETGGGMANAIVGSGKLLLLATLDRHPDRLPRAASTWPSTASKTFRFVVRYVTDLLNGVPSIVIGIFAYTVIVLRMQHFSALAGGLRWAS